jgi:hypothetical protein
MHRFLLISTVIAGLVLSACAQGPTNDATGGGTGAGTSSSPQESQRYEATAFVLEGKAGSPMLCLGAIATSLPPQCGDVPITNWNWDGVDGEQRAAGSTWGDYHVVGTFDGTSFTVVDVGPPGKSSNGESDIEIPCQAPAGGWVASDPGRMSYDDLQAAMRLAEAEPDSSGFWIKHTREPNAGGFETYDDVVVNAAFTGDLERHRSDLSQVWGGPLCVVGYERSYTELHRIRTEVEDGIEKEFGLHMLFSDIDIVHNKIEIGVIVADAETKATIDAHYGEGTVQLVPALRPVT